MGYKTFMAPARSAKDRYFFAEQRWHFQRQVKAAPANDHWEQIE
jgi:hypothetical protein